MSLKEKLAALATEKIAENLVSKDKVDDVINLALTGLGKAMGQKTATEHIKQIKKNYLVVKAKSYSVGTIVGALSSKAPDTDDYLGRYQIIDVSGEIRYMSTAEGSLIIDREVLDLYDANNHKIGYVKEHLISVGIPLLEKDVKKCSVYLGKEKIAELKRYRSFGDLNFDVLDGDVEIKHQKGKQFQIFYKKRLIATLHDVPFNLKDGYAEKFVMEYENPSTEVVAVLLTTAIDLLKPY